jgi:hypothetical protein
LSTTLVSLKLALPIRGICFTVSWRTPTIRIAVAPRTCHVYIMNEPGSWLTAAAVRVRLVRQESARFDSSAFDRERICRRSLASLHAPAVRRRASEREAAGNTWNQEYDGFSLWITPLVITSHHTNPPTTSIGRLLRGCIKMSLYNFTMIEIKI